MAKKSFNISSTLSKNKTEKEPTPEELEEKALQKRQNEILKK